MAIACGFWRIWKQNSVAKLCQSVHGGGTAEQEDTLQSDQSPECQDSQ